MPANDKNKEDRQKDKNSQQTAEKKQQIGRTDLTNGLLKRKGRLNIPNGIFAFFKCFLRNRLQKPVTDFRNCLDKTRILRIIPKRAAKFGNCPRQNVVNDIRIAPDGFEKSFFSDNPHRIFR